MSEPSFLTSLVSGGMAGMAVDISLFPLDTVKTRLQSKYGLPLQWFRLSVSSPLIGPDYPHLSLVRQGFWAAGGFRNIYSGLGPAAVGSAPNAAIFFCTYDTVKRVAVAQLGCQVPDSWSLTLLSLLC